MHLTPTHHPNHAAFAPTTKIDQGFKSKSELSVHSPVHTAAFLSPGPGSRPSSSGSSVRSLDMSWNVDEQRAVDAIHANRKQLEDEIEVALPSVVAS